MNLASPDWMLAGFDSTGEIFQFAQVSRQTYQQSSFLDHRIQPMPERLVSASGAEVDGVLTGCESKPAGYIFHSAFCTSTLLSFCLDHQPKTLVLREPMVLSRLASHNRGLASADGALPALLRQRVLGLLERSYAAESVIIKPSNIANALIPGILQTAPGQPAQRRCVLLSCSLYNLLVSILKKTDEARGLLPRFLAALLKDSNYLQRVQLPSLESLDLLQQSAVFWHCQRYLFNTIRAEFGAQQVLPLSMEFFLREPLQALTAINDFLGLGLGVSELETTVTEGAFLQHAKAGTRYAPQQRQEEAEQVARRYGREIESTLAWMQPTLRNIPVEPLDVAENLLT